MNKHPFLKPFAWLAILVMVVSLACNIGGGTTPTGTPLPPANTPTTEQMKSSPTPEEVATQTKKGSNVIPTPEATATTGTQSGGAGMVTALDGVQSATIQIESTGTFLDPQVGQVVNGAGRGSGFIIDPSGIAITNNHVVTGAATLKVWVGGSQAKTYHARVLGASECSDLAVIQIETGNLPYLGWHDGTPKTALEVYSAGFPLGDPQFTITKGIVSKASANGDTSWASIENVIEHTATINPGNSGGPLVDASGKVVAINFASIASTNQYFAIARDEAMMVIDQLKSGKDVTSIGVNGQAVVSKDQTISGIWVSSVKSGSPADKAGVKPGDIIYQMENLVLATDGSMKDYCSILRSHKDTDTLSIKVLRFATQQILEGELNGRVMAVTGQFGGSTGGSSGSTATQAPASQYTLVTDDSGAISVEVPSEWADVNGKSWNSTWSGVDFNVPSISASANLKNYDAGYDESGVFFAAGSDIAKIGGYVQMLDGVKSWYSANCKFDSRNDYSDDQYEGKYDIWKTCGKNKNEVMVMVLRPKVQQTAYLILMEVKVTKDADLESLKHILLTFKIN
jgi:serine protease Do